MLLLLLLFISTASTPTSWSTCNDEHMRNIEEVPPAINIFSDRFDTNGNNELQTLRNEVINNACNFGDEYLSSSLFSFAPNYINLHCGSYGSQPKYVVKYHDHIRDVLYNKPHAWDDLYSVDIMNILRSEIANYLGIQDMNDLVFTINASHGLNSVMRSLMDHFLSQYMHNISDYAVIYFNTAHSSIVAPLKYYQTLFNIELIEIKLDEYIVNDYENIIKTINNTLQHLETNKVLFAVFSHITSLPSFIFPLKRMIQLFHDHGIMTIVDGAHAFGQIYNVDISDSECDIYVSNAYKWFYSVLNTAIMYVSKQYQDIINPLAFVYQNASFQKLFHHPGTVDRSAYLSLMGSIEFRHLIGGDIHIINYNHNIAIDAQLFLSNLWNTTVFLSNSDYFSAMVNVELSSIDGVEINKPKLDAIYLKLLEDDNIAIKLFEWNHKFYARISCQIYTNMNQIQQIGNLILQYIHAIKGNDTLKKEL